MAQVDRLKLDETFSGIAHDNTLPLKWDLDLLIIRHHRQLSISLVYKLYFFILLYLRPRWDFVFIIMHFDMKKPNKTIMLQ